MANDACVVEERPGFGDSVLRKLSSGTTEYNAYFNGVLANHCPDQW